VEVRWKDNVKEIMGVKMWIQFIWFRIEFGGGGLFGT
jgi:hypothetical protein